MSDTNLTSDLRIAAEWCGTLSVEELVEDSLVVEGGSVDQPTVAMHTSLGDLAPSGNAVWSPLLCNQGTPYMRRVC